MNASAEFEHAAAVPCPLQPGGCTIHHHRTLHFAAPNISDTARYTYIMTFGVTPKPLPEKRSFAWLNHKETPIQETKRRWLRRGGLLITAWRRLRRGDLVSWQAAGLWHSPFHQTSTPGNLTKVFLLARSKSRMRGQLVSAAPVIKQG